VGRKIRWPRHVDGFTDRHGRPRFYFRRAGKRVTLPGLPWSPEFMVAYEAAMAGETAPPPSIEIGASRTAIGSVNHAIVGYYKSSAFAALAPLTQQNRRAILERFRAEHGDKRLAMLQRQHVARIVQALKPYAQRNLLKTLRGLMTYAIDNSLIADDPTLGVKPVKVAKSPGFYTWQEHDVARFEARHPIGSLARLAFALMLYLGVRRSDVVRIGRQHIRGGVFSIKPQKTTRTTGIEIHVPVHPELAQIIAATPASGQLTFLATLKGKARSAKGFGNRMRQWCDEAGLPECSSHGLRKACARRLAEAGATEKQIAAVTGHTDLREVETYTRAADNKKMAVQAIEKMTAAFGSKSEQELPNPATRFGKSAKKAN
jgi:integrase